MDELCETPRRKRRCDEDEANTISLLDDEDEDQPSPLSSSAASLLQANADNPSASKKRATETICPDDEPEPVPADAEHAAFRPDTCDRQPADVAEPKPSVRSPDSLHQSLDAADNASVHNVEAICLDDDDEDVPDESEAATTASDGSPGSSVSAMPPAAVQHAQTIAGDGLPASGFVPLLSITFRDQATVDRLQSVVQQAVCRALAGQRISYEIVNVPDGASRTLHINEFASGSDDACSFVVDASPAPERRPSGRDGAASNGHRHSPAPAATGDESAPPKYSVNVASTFDPTTLHRTPPADERLAHRGLSCFNCSGDHNMRDCREPRNAQRIRDNRALSGQQHGRAERYHVELGQKYGHIEPGQLSGELRRALGLHPGDIPLHVYRMRALGYPPGWLEAARIQPSGLALIDADAPETPVAGGGSSEQYDLKRIYAFAGFNEPPEPGTYDISRSLRLPPLRPDQSRQRMLAALGGSSSRSYQRQRQTVDAPPNDHSIDLTAAEMDLEDGEEPDLDELHERQERLLAELDDAADEPSAPADRSTPVRPVPGERSPDESTATPLNGSKCSVSGTPLLESASEFSEVPDGAKWSVGVSEIIDFENLADSIGKYERMKGLIQKVRVSVRELNAEYDDA